MENAIETKLKEFDRNIRREMKSLQTFKPYLCESYYMKQIFLETIDFNISDWRELRKDDYYDKKQSYSRTIDKKKFTLKKVLEYKKKLF